MRDWHTRDFTLNGMRAALEEVIAAFPIYRPYVSSRGVSAEDHRYIEWALIQARKRRHAVDTSIFDFLHKVLTGGPADCAPDPGSAEMLRVAMHFQQVTGPVMAKAYEDTAFYRYVRLVALNEVGGDPRRFGTSVAAFHHVTAARARLWPQAMVTTATHDTKRGEDARARVALLSELPFVWGRQVARWSRLNRSRRSETDGEIVPDRNVEYLFYQALLGAWPPNLSLDDVEGMQDIAERLEAYMIKAVREGKERSSWSNPDANYEAGLQRFVRGVLDSSRTNPFLVEFHNFVTSLARLGAISSLSQLVLKLTVPGVPDIYQGGELWDFSLVDPDNRRPVDWQMRRELLGKVDGASVTDFSRSWQNGLEKLFIIRRLLGLRRSYPELFAQGDYRPIEPEEDSGNHVCAFARVRGEEEIIVVVPRLVYRLYQGGCSANWGAAKVGLPPGKWRDVFTGRCQDGDAPVLVSQLLADFPVAVLSSGMDT
jgi:(1->4)-alpha-D-glucan 1-alpha-D-glucosylmutase